MHGLSYSSYFYAVYVVQTYFRTYYVSNVPLCVRTIVRRQIVPTDLLEREERPLPGSRRPPLAHSPGIPPALSTRRKPSSAPPRSRPWPQCSAPPPPPLLLLCTGKGPPCPQTRRWGRTPRSPACWSRLGPSFKLWMSLLQLNVVSM